MLLFVIWFSSQLNYVDSRACCVFLFISVLLFYLTRYLGISALTFLLLRRPLVRFGTLCCCIDASQLSLYLRDAVCIMANALWLRKARVSSPTSGTRVDYNIKFNTCVLFDVCIFGHENRIFFFPAVFATFLFLKRVCACVRARTCQESRHCNWRVLYRA